MKKLTCQVCYGRGRTLAPLTTNASCVKCGGTGEVDGSTIICEDKKSFTHEMEGSISHATFRPQDLIPKFAKVIDLFVECGGELYNSHGWETLKKEIDLLCEKDDDDSEWYSENTSDILNEDLFHILNDLAPDGFLFGSHEGNGSDFGFWAYCMEDCSTCVHEGTDFCSHDCDEE